MPSPGREGGIERVPGSVSHSAREQGGAGISLRASGTDTVTLGVFIEELRRLQEVTIFVRGSTKGVRHPVW